MKAMMKAVSHLSLLMFLASHSSLNLSSSDPVTRSSTDWSYLKDPPAVCSEVRANSFSISVLGLSSTSAERGAETVLGPEALLFLLNIWDILDRILVEKEVRDGREAWNDLLFLLLRGLPLKGAVEKYSISSSEKLQQYSSTPSKEVQREARLYLRGIDIP